MSRRRIGRGIRPNVGTGEAYRKALEKLVDEMTASLNYWLVRRWSEAPPTLAMDERWDSALQRTIRELRRRWTDRFDEAAPKLATHYAKRAADRATGEIGSILADAGMVVDFKVSPAVRTAMSGIVGDNVSLIKSIASEHLTQVEGIVMRSASLGRDLETMSRELREKFEVPKKRAALIARDQNNKMTATITRVRQQEAGIDQAIWMHSHAGRKPRPEHVAFSGHTYDVAKGAYLEGVWTWPGVEINCRCYSKPVLPGF